DVVAPTITATSPANSAGVTSSAVNYTLSEDCSTAQVTWTRTGGTADGTSPHTRTLVGAELNAGVHTSITFGSNPLVGAAIYTIAWDCSDAAGNAATTVTATGVTYSDGPPVITSALALDTNYNGKIDTYQVTFNKNIQDNSFPGYVANSLGNAQTDWLVAGYTNVRLLNGTAVTFATDTANDSVIYIRFNENVLACDAATQTGCDTDAKPDLTTSATPGVSDGVQTLAQVGVATVTEADGAAPVTVRALSLGPTALDVTFSEPINATQANVAANYALTGGLSVSAAARDGVNFRILHLTTSAQTGGTSYTLTVNTTLRDAVNINLITNTNPTTGLPANQAQFNGVDKPVVVGITTKSATTLLIEINESIVEASAICANQTACSSIYTNLALPVLSAVAANASGTATPGNSKYFLLTVNAMIEGQAYTTTVTQNTMTSVATGQKMGNANNAATFNGDGKPAATISSDTASQCPTPTNLPPSAPARQRLIVQYDQAVDSSATTAANYTIPAAAAGGCVQPACSSGLNQTASTVTSMGGNKYAVDWPTAFDTAGTPPNGNIYLLNVANVKDMNGNTVATPTTAQFQCGNDNTPPMLSSVTVVSASNAAVVVLLTFSEAVDNVTANTVTNYRYDTTAYGTNVTTAARQSNQAQVLVTFTPGTALSNGGHQMRVINVKDQSANTITDDGVNNVQPFIVNAPTGFTGGPIFEDPFADGTPAGQIVRYNNKLLLGWNNGSSQLFEMNNGLTTAQTIILDVDGNPTMPYTALSSWASGGGASETDGGSGTITGIDAIASACARTATATGSWKASLTGAACTAQNGVEYLLMGGFNSTGYYKSYFTTTDTSNTTTHFTFNHRVHQTDSSNTFRSMTMVVFSDWLYVASPHVGFYAPMLARICINKDGCNDGTARAFWDAVHAGNAGNVGSPGTNGLLPMLSKFGTQSSANTGSSPNSSNGNSNTNNTLSIDTIFEYDNDGAGANVSQLYMANGGRFGGTVGYGVGTSRINLANGASTLGTDGGVIRSRLARSTATRPPGCGTAYGSAPIANDAATCLTNGFENITPTNQDWLDYMSIALPYRSDGTTDWYDMLPSNRIIPAMKAVPYMRTAPNGDLYMVRNACATAIMQTKCMVGGGAPCLGAGPVAARLNDRFNDNFATAATGRHQTCPPGYEVPQLWVLPAKGASGTGGGGEGGNNNAADWKLVAGSLFTPPAFAQGTNTVTPRTDVLPQRKSTTLRANTGTCGSSPNKCERNAHLTLMEFVGNTLYLGFDNQDYGANVWRVDFTNSSCTGSSDCMTPGKIPAETSFAIVNNVLGLDGSSVNQRIFSHVAVSDGGTDWLILVTRDGSNSMKIYRTGNGQN
ncbi:MAG: hypothetical protein JSR44_04145, partial [Spirochaetes bacterium]|nr:hypothetical protein [Spirochaetota bacterium]